MPNKIVTTNALKKFRKKLDDKYVIEGEYSPDTIVGSADEAYKLFTERTIDDLDVSCPPITYGIAGGDAEIRSGRYDLVKLFGNTIYDEENYIYKSAKSAKLFSRGKNQWVGWNEITPVIPGQEYVIFGHSGTVTELLDDLTDNDVYMFSSGVPFTVGNVDKIRVIPTAVAAGTQLPEKIMLYNTFGESYNEPYEAPKVETVTLPNITLRSFGDVRDEIWNTGGGIRRVGVLEINAENLIEVSSGHFEINLIPYNSDFRFIPENATISFINDDYYDYDVELPVHTGMTANIFLGGDDYTTRKLCIDTQNITKEQLLEDLQHINIIYELAEPEEISLEENPGWDDIYVDNYGTLMFLDENNDKVTIEQPYQINYTIDLVEFLDSSFVKAKGNASDLALESDLLSGNLIPALSAVSQEAESIHTERVIGDLDISCPPITYGIAGGDAEINTGVQELTKLFGNTVYDEDGCIYKSSKAAKLVSRGKNQFTGFDEFIDVLSSEEYRIFTNLPSGVLLAEYTKDKEQSGFDYDLSGIDFIISGYENMSNSYFDDGTRYIKLVPVDPTEVTDKTEVMMYLTFEESYDEPYEKPQVEEVELPNLTLRSFDGVRDEIYATGGGIRRVGAIEVTEENLEEDGDYYSLLLPQELNSYGFLPENVFIDSYGQPKYEYRIEISNGLIVLVGCYPGDSSIYLEISNSDYTKAEVIELLSGIKFIYKLDEEEEITTQENPGWDSGVFIDNYGTLLFLDENDNEIEIEQPYEVLYKASLVEFLDSAFVKAKGNASDIALISELEDGTVVPFLSEQANDLAPYSDNSGVRDATPFVFQTSGGDADIGDKAYIEKLSGNTAKIAQLCKDGNFEDENFESKYKQYVYGLRTNSVANNELLLYTSGGDWTYAFKTAFATLKKNRAYIFKMDIISNASKDVSVCLGVDNGGTILANQIYIKTLQFGWNTICFPFNYIENNMLVIKGSDFGYNSFVKIRNIQIFDFAQLSETFNVSGNLFDLQKYIPEFIEYTEGKFAFTKPSAYKTIGYNACNEDWELGTYHVNENKIAKITDTDCFRLKNPIKVVPSADYYFSFDDTLFNSNLSMLAEIYFTDKYMNIVAAASDITSAGRQISVPKKAYYAFVAFWDENDEQYFTDVSKIPQVKCVFNLLWDETKTGYEKYHEETYRFPNVTLRKCGNVSDELYSDGTLIRRVGIVDLGDLDWTCEGDDIVDTCFSSSVIDDIKPTTDNDTYTAENIQCEGQYEKCSFDDLNVYKALFSIAQNNNGKIYLIADLNYSIPDLKEHLKGIHLLYELATPVVEKSDAYKFTRITDVDDWGTQEILSNEEIVLPQPITIFYPPNYKAFIDTLGNRVGYDATKINTKTSPKNMNVLNHENKIRDFVVYKVGTLTFYGHVWVAKNNLLSMALCSGNCLTRSNMYGTKIGNKYMFDLFDDLDYVNAKSAYGPYSLEGNKYDYENALELDDLMIDHVLPNLYEESEDWEISDDYNINTFPEQKSIIGSGAPHVYQSIIDDSDFSMGTAHYYLRKTFIKGYLNHKSVANGNNLEIVKPLFSKTMIKFAAGKRPSHRAISNLWFEIITRVDTEGNVYKLRCLVIRRNFRSSK